MLNYAAVSICFFDPLYFEKKRVTGAATNIEEYVPTKTPKLTARKKS